VKTTFRRKAIPALLSVVCAGSAFASGFALQNQNGAGTGNAFAGAAASPEDASTIYFNPAGMLSLSGTANATVAVTSITRKIDFTNNGTAALTLPTTGAPTTFAAGTNGGNAGGTSLVPAGYLAYALGKDLSIGFGVSPTFGNRTEYSSDFAGRFSGYMTDVKIFNFNPSIAYKVSDTVSLGFGANYGTADLEFLQKVPVGIPSSAAPSTWLESVANIKGTGNAWGYNAGAMFNLSKETNVGLAYRSKIKYKLDGSMTVTLPSGTVAQNLSINSELETPDTTSLAVSHKLTPKLELLADYTWTGWSTLKSLDVYNNAGGAKVTSLKYNFRDTYRVGVGGNYQLNETLKLRAGVAYDQSPVSDVTDRTMTLPDSDRTWLSFGGRYNLSKASSVDVGYTHIFFKKEDTQRAVSSSTGSTIQTVKGSFDTAVDIISLQYNQSF